MAVARMSHLRLVGLRAQENKIMDVLTSGGMFEARATDEVSFALESGGATLLKELKLKQSRISFALDFIRQRHDAMAYMLKANAKDIKKGIADRPLDFELSDKKFGSARMLITHADFADVRAKEYDLLGVCDSLQQLSFELADAKLRLGELRAERNKYEPYAAFPLKLSELGDRGGIVLALYYSKTAGRADDILSAFRCAFEMIESDGLLYAVICRTHCFTELEKRMNAAGYERCTLSDDCTARQKTDAADAETDDIDRHIYEITKDALAYEKYYDELRILYDVVELETERAEADALFLKTDSTFVLEGWLPESCAKSVVGELKEKFPATFVQLLAPEERDAPPTLAVNSRFVQPYEDVTNMYTPPKYREIDPNPIMSIFYFVFFGIMVGDAAYGLVLAVIGLVLGYSKRFDSGMKKLLLLIGWGGVSSLIWGIVFGGYFAIDFGATKVALWFNPLDEPLTMLVLSIVLGCVQLTAGYVIKFIKLCMAGEPFSAVCDAGPIIIIFAALAVFGLSMAIPDAPGGLTTAAIALAATGVAIMLVFGGRKSKNIFGKVFGGFKELYGLINLMSDVLSYCRLFGLCLASCAIGLAFNTLGNILFGIPVAGYPIGIILLIPLHAFNLAMGVLSAYVHDARLQFLEFYGKFYDGEGRLFAPIGQRTKHIRFA